MGNLIIALAVGLFGRCGRYLIDALAIHDHFRLKQSKRFSSMGAPRRARVQRRLGQGEGPQPAPQAVANRYAVDRVRQPGRSQEIGI